MKTVKDILAAGPVQDRYDEGVATRKRNQIQTLTVGFVRKVKKDYPDASPKLLANLLAAVELDPALLDFILQGHTFPNAPKLYTAEDPELMKEAKTVRKKRALRNNKLTESDVAFIKRAIIDRSITQEQMAEIYGVSIATISNISRGKTWVHVTPAPAPPDDDFDREFAIPE